MTSSASVQRNLDEAKTSGPSTHRSPTQGLTKRQQQVLQLIEQFQSDHGYPPSIREIGEALTISTSRAHELLKALEKKGYIRRNSAKRRALEVNLQRPGTPPRTLPAYVPLVGQIAAGRPMLTEEQVEEMLPFPPQLIGGGQTFMLRICGDLMSGDGLYDGDYVVARRQDRASEGEIVIALVDDEVTVKRVTYKGGQMWLSPSNPAYEPREGTHASIQGKVVLVLRKL